MSFGPVLYTLRPIWIKFHTKDVHKNVLNDSEFRETRRIQSHILLWRADLYVWCLLFYLGAQIFMCGVCYFT
jgi:hypothetical protein